MLKQLQATTTNLTAMYYVQLTTATTWTTTQLR